MADIFREVDEELRQERIQKLWQLHGQKFVAGCLAIVIITAGFVMYRNWKISETARITGDLAAAISQVELAKDDDARALAVKSLAAFAEKAPAGPANLARLQLAADQAKADDAKAALATWQAVADDSRADSLLRDLARLRIAAAMLDTAEPKILKAQLEPLAADKATYRGSAGLLLAVVDLRENNNAAAKTRLSAIAADADLPAGLRERARRLAETIVTAAASAPAGQSQAAPAIATKDPTP